jgi:hypothetical protein
MSNLRQKALTNEGKKTIRQHNPGEAPGFMRIFVLRQRRQVPGGAICIETYMSAAWDEPDAFGKQKSS